jgi:hypothetical protein
MALQLRRGTNQQRLGLTPVEGEMIYVTDNILATISVTGINDGTDTLSTTTPHGLTVDQQVKYTGATLNGLTKDQVYFVKTAPTITDFTLSTTLGGGTLNITGSYTVPLVFAKTPCDATGAPLGYDVSPLWAGDGTTVGGNPAGSILLDELRDVVITKPPVEGEFLWYNGTTWVNENQTTVDTSAKTLSLTRRYSTGAGEEYESPIAQRLNARVTDATNDNTDDAGPSIRFQRSSGTEYTKTYVSGGAIGAFTVTLNNVTNLVVGNKVTGTGLPQGNGALITIIAGNQLTLDTAFTAQAAGTYTIGEPVGFGQLAFEYYGTTDLHKFKVTTSTDDYLENPANTYPGTKILIESTKNYTDINQGVVYVDAVNNRLGINDTTPSSSLDVNGTANITGNLTVDTNTLYVDATNNRVGILNTSPTVALDVTGAAAVSGAATVGGNLTVDTNTLFVNASTNRVGILNTSPTVPLDVTGAAAVSGNLTVDSGTLFVDATNNRVGINNTSPSYELHIDNAQDAITQFAMTNNERTFILTNDAGNNYLSHSYGGANRLQFDLTDQWFNSGRLGIGQTSPAYELDVSGSARFTVVAYTPSVSTLASDDLNISAFSGKNINITATNGADGGGLTLAATTCFDPVTIVRNTANSATATRALTVRVNNDGTGTIGVGFGSQIEYEVETATGVFKSAGFTDVVATNVTTGDETFKMRFGVMNDNTTASSKMELDSLGNLQIDGDLTVTGTNITTGATNTAVSVDVDSSVTDLPLAALTVKTTIDGTPATGFGTAINFSAQTTAGPNPNFENAGFIAVASTNITATEEDFRMRFGLMNDGDTYTTVMELDSLGNLAPDGKVTVGTTLECPSDDTVTSSAISLTTASTIFTTTTVNQTSTLAAGADGQFKSLVRSGDTGGGQMVVTVTNAGWKTSGTGTITFGNIGDGCLLQYIGSKWFAVGINDVVFA